MFDTNHEFFLHQPIHHVNYIEKYPQLNPLKTPENDWMDLTLLSKSIEWKYEEEWRLFHFNRKPGLYPFPPEALAGIIFGYRLPKQKRGYIEKWTRLGKSHPTFYETVISDYEYKISIQKVENIDGNK